jgi:hypothetical protein
MIELGWCCEWAERGNRLALPDQHPRFPGQEAAFAILLFFRDDTFAFRSNTRPHEDHFPFFRIFRRRFVAGAIADEFAQIGGF